MEVLQKKKVRKKEGSVLKEGEVLVLTGKYERGLRLVFMEELMERACAADMAGANAFFQDMVAAGLRPGPHSFHGLVVAHTLGGDEEGAMESLKRELNAGVRPLQHTFIALLRLFAARGHTLKGQKILAGMESLNFDVRRSWIILVEELLKNGHLGEANKVFLRGVEGGLRATDELYDVMIVEDCKAGDHSNALTIAYEMEKAGRMATTFHFNCLLSVQANCGIPEIAFATFENMAYSGEDFMKPNIETYNWVIQAYTRAEKPYDRVPDLAVFLGTMLEDHKWIQPNVRTYALLVEFFTKYSMTKEAIRHFRALRTYEGGTKVLHNEGNHGDPLSLYIRALCREGRVVDLYEALEAMARDNQPIPPRAMILNRKYRSLVSSWIEPLHEEAELGFEVDYIARYIEEGGLTGDRKRWVPRPGREPLDPDAKGFLCLYPMLTSYKQRCLQIRKEYHCKILKRLRHEGVAALGSGVSEQDFLKVKEALKSIRGPNQNALKPKAASKMLVSELREELDAQGLPTDGTRQVLYQRVQKARRINRYRGRPLWVPPVEEIEEVDEYIDELISRVQLHEGDTEFWKKRFFEEGLKIVNEQEVERDESNSSEILDDADSVEDSTKDEEDPEEMEKDGLEEEEEQAEAPAVDAGESEDANTRKKVVLEMFGAQLLKSSDETSISARNNIQKLRKIILRDPNSDEKLRMPQNIQEGVKFLRERKIFDGDDMYTIADAWGWTWEKELKAIPPQKWSEEKEVELALQIMSKVTELGAMPTIGDCAMILRAAIRAPIPSSILEVLQATHKLGYKFGRPLYDEVITLCLKLEELDAAVAIVAELETNGIKVSDETLDGVLAAQKVDLK